MPITKPIDEKSEKELYENIYNKSQYIGFKSIRFDEQDFWSSFVAAILQEKYLSLGWDIQKIRVNPRMGEKEEFKVTRKNGVVETKKYQEYTKQQKKDYSKKNSTSLAFIGRGKKHYLPGVFGHDKREFLTGIMLFLDNLDEDYLHPNYLPSSITLYDNGTVGRPYHHHSKEEADNYLKEKQQNNIWHNTIESLINAGLNETSQDHNEILARLKWTPDSVCQIGVFSDNLTSRLIGQMRAQDIKNNTNQEFVPVSFYLPENNPPFFPYYLKEQEEDLKRGLSSTNPIIVGIAKLVKLLSHPDDSNDITVDKDVLLLLIGNKISSISKQIVLEKIKTLPHPINNNDITLVFIEAIKQNDQKMIGYILTNYANNLDFKLKDQTQNNALMVAINTNNIEIVKLILENHSTNIDFEAKNDRKNNILMTSINSKNIEMIKLILENYSDNINFNAENIGKDTALNLAIKTKNIKIVKLILEKHSDNIDFNAENIGKDTVITLAIKTKNIEIVKLILEKYLDTPRKIPIKTRQELMRLTKKHFTEEHEQQIKDILNRINIAAHNKPTNTSNNTAGNKRKIGPNLEEKLFDVNKKIKILFRDIDRNTSDNKNITNTGDAIPSSKKRKK